VRPARLLDVQAIADLVNGYADEQTMLPKTPATIAMSLDDYVVVADERGGVLACGALREYSPSLAEVAAVAVQRSAHGAGLGRRIVDAVEDLARARGIPEVFALTLTPGFFATLGYEIVARERYPEKIRRDCVGCPRRVGCREVCVAKVIDVAGAVAA
jgi:amino-acid N-acetyltransferase